MGAAPAAPFAAAAAGRNLAVLEPRAPIYAYTLFLAVGAIGLLIGLLVVLLLRPNYIAFIVLVSVGPICWLAYFVHSWRNATGRAICRRYSNEMCLNEHLARLQEKRPTIGWHMVCYHYETESYTDSDGNSQTRSRRVDTWRGADVYAPPGGWRNDFDQMPQSEAFSSAILRVRCDLLWMFEPAALAQYEAQKSAFVAANAHRDAHYDSAKAVS